MGDVSHPIIPEREYYESNFSNIEASVTPTFKIIITNDNLDYERYVLADPKLIEVCALEISFQHHIAMPGQVRLKWNIVQSNLRFEVTLADAPENSTIIIKATPCIKVSGMIWIKKTLT